MVVTNVITNMKTRNTHMKYFLMALMGTILMLSPARAQDAQIDIARYQQALQNISTMKADFPQTAYDGTQTTGTFFLNRPGRLRFEYDQLDDFIVADGTFIYYYDSEMKQQSSTRISNSLADFLLRDRIRLDGDVTVTETSRSNGLTNLTLTMTEDPGAGALTLSFVDANGKPVLKKWTVMDSQGLKTDVVLKNIKTGLKLPKNLFYYIDPQRYRPTFN